MKFALVFLVISAVVVAISADSGNNKDKKMSVSDKDGAVSDGVLSEHMIAKRSPRYRPSSSSSSSSEERPRRRGRQGRHQHGRTADGSGEGRFLQTAVVDNGIYPGGLGLGLGGGLYGGGLGLGAGLGVYGR